MAEVSVVIPNYNQRNLLDRVLRDLSLQQRLPEEVVVVDNGSADGSATMVRQEFPEVRLLALSVNTGFCGGNNRAYAEARADLLLLLNNYT